MRLLKSPHFFKIIIPLLAGACFIALSTTKLSSSFYYGLPSSASIVLPILIVCITIIFLFHLATQFFNLKIATIITFTASLIFGLINLTSAPDGHLANLLETIYLANSSSETIVIADTDLYKDFQSYPSPQNPPLSTYPDSADHFWLISYLPDTEPVSPLENYEITDEISTPYHLAIKLERSQ